MDSKFPAIILLFSLAFFPVGCKSNSAKPSNPFAQNLKTVPPPATFSSQESYLGQTPAPYIPQTPATTFPPSGTITSPQPAGTSPATVPVPVTSNSNERATVFAATTESDWTPVVATTSKTAFQAMEAKIDSATSVGGIPIEAESLIVGTSYAVTTIADESQSESPLPEPGLLLYSGN